MKGKVLVTGGTGYIGSHTVVSLLDAGFEVIILDNLRNSLVEVLGGILSITGKQPIFHQVDLSSKKDLDAVFKEYQGQIESVIHFAALKAVGESVSNPLMYYSVNLTGLLNLLDCMAKSEVKKLVFSSSCTVYGEPDSLPVTEAHQVKKPESPYGNTKKMGEEILQDVCNQVGIKCISLRYFNPIGAHPSGQIGELPIGTPNNLVPLVTAAAAGRRKPITVYGTDYPTKDGTCIRDYIHVVDLAKAHLLALDYIDKLGEVNYQAINVGTGNGYSVLEVIQALEIVTGFPVPHVLGDRRAGDVISIYADATLANRLLNWTAQYDLIEMMSHSWKWENKLQGLYGDALLARDKAQS